MAPKKLIVLCDGTWQNSDIGWDKGGITGLFKKGHPQTPTNVTRIGRALLPEHPDGRSQIVYYQAGVGSGWSISDRVFGGGLALGISENIREAYSFIVNNFHGQDEIFLMGFSRGAFTARSIGGMMGDIGLLTKDAMDYFYQIFEDYENAGEEGYMPKLPGRLEDFDPEKDFAHPPLDINEYLKLYRSKLDRLKWTRTVNIRAIAVWDTVGTLGVPITPWLQKLGFPSTISEYRFFNTRIGPHVENAFHALALDERRSAFQAAVWEKSSDNTVTNLEQMWFPGAHSDVGGGVDDDNSQANITLAWMMTKLKPFLAFQPDYIEKQVAKNPAMQKKKDWTWGQGEIHNSLKFPLSLAGSAIRTPGTYEKLDYPSGRKTGVLLEATHEKFHASTRARKCFGGKGIDGKAYDPASLKDWKDEGPPAAGECAKWTYHGDRKNIKYMEEGTMDPKSFEKDFLDMDPKMEGQLFK